MKWVTSEIVSGQLIWADIYKQFLLTHRLGDLELKAKLAQSQRQQREEFLGRKAGLSFPRLQFSWGAWEPSGSREGRKRLPNAHFK